MKKKKIYTIREALIESVYINYKRTINMNFTELLGWARNPISKFAYFSRRELRHNLELLKTPKNKWNMKHVRWANKTISFIKRFKNIKTGKPLSKNCPYSKKTLNLKNRAFDPNKR